MRKFLAGFSLLLFANLGAAQAASMSKECLDNPLAKGCSAKPTPPKQATTTKSNESTGNNSGTPAPTNKGR